MWNQWVKTAQLAYEAQSVWAGGPRAAAEAQRMITEKFAALAAAQRAAAVALMGGSTPGQVGARALTPVRRRVRANYRRLRRRRSS